MANVNKAQNMRPALNASMNYINNLTTIPALTDFFTSNISGVTVTVLNAVRCGDICFMNIKIETDSSTSVTAKKILASKNTWLKSVATGTTKNGYIFSIESDGFKNYTNLTSNTSETVSITCRVDGSNF